MSVIIYKTRWYQLISPKKHCPFKILTWNKFFLHLWLSRRIRHRGSGWSSRRHWRTSPCHLPCLDLGFQKLDKHTRSLQKVIKRNESAWQRVFCRNRHKIQHAYFSLCQLRLTACISANPCLEWNLRSWIQKISQYIWGFTFCLLIIIRLINRNI